MPPLNETIEALHDAYREATNYILPLNQVSERWWYEATKLGLLPEQILAVVKSRLKGVQAGERRQNCLLLRNFCGSEEAIQGVLEEAAMLEAKGRMKVFVPDKASVLRATGRNDTPEPPMDKKVSTIMIEALRKAAS